MLAIILAVDALWEMAPALLRAVRSSSQAGACAAAQVAVVRGDLWAECAVGDSDPSRGDRPAGNADAPAALQARAAAGRALVLAPHDARAWLALASAEARFDSTSRTAEAALRMSYYTGPNEAALIPLRLMTFGQLDTSRDPDLQQLARREITNVVDKRPELKSAIVAAYREALPASKRFFDDVLREVDPKLLATLRP